MNGHVAVAELLLANGASIDLASRFRNTPLNVAAYQGHTASVALLLANHARVGTALYWAAKNGRVACVQALLREQVASVDDADEDGSTALFSAAYNRSRACVLALLGATLTSATAATVQRHFA